MKNFTSFTNWLYTDVIFGRDVENMAGAMIKKHGGTAVMVVYGGGSIKKSGLYDRVIDSIKKESLSYVELGGVRPNPRRSLVEQGIKLAQEEKIDFLLAIGGGSTIDTAKAIGLGIKSDGDYWDFYTKKRVPQLMERVGTIHTIAAAGSEMSASTVLLDDIDTGKKYGCMCYGVNQPVFALMNPELTYTLSEYQTAAGAVDVYSHTFERYLTKSDCCLGDQFALGLLKTVVKYAPIALEKPQDYEARAELMLSGAYSHNNITCLGRSGTTYTVHWLEAYLTGKYDTAHGAGLALLMPAWLRYIIKHGGEHEIARVAQIATSVFNVTTDYLNPQEVALEGIRRFSRWLKDLHMPQTLGDMGIPESDLDELVDGAPYNALGIVEGFMDLDRGQVYEIFDSLR